MSRGRSQTERVLNVWAISLIIWSLFRAYFRTSLDPLIDEFIAKPLVFLIPAYIFISRNEKKPFWQYVGFMKQGALKEVFYGLLVGSIFFIGGFIATGAKFNPNVFFQAKFALAAVTAFAASFSEEILSRGFVLKQLYEQSKNIFTSSFLASILFFFLHVPILFTAPNMSGMLLLKVMITDLILSLAVSFVFLSRKENIIMPIMIHALYTLSLFLFI